MSEPEADEVDRSGAVCYSNSCTGEPTHRVRWEGGDNWYGICGACAESIPVSRGTVLAGLTPETITTHPVSTDGGQSSDGTVRLDSAKVVWKDDEYATAAGIPVEILSNGWIYTPETNQYHPPNEVERVERYVDTETDHPGGDR